MEKMEISFFKLFSGKLRHMLKTVLPEISFLLKNCWKIVMWHYEWRKNNKNAKKGQFWVFFKNLVVNQCYQTDNFQLTRFHFSSLNVFWRIVTHVKQCYQTGQFSTRQKLIKNAKFQIVLPDWSRLKGQKFWKCQNVKQCCQTCPV